MSRAETIVDDAAELLPPPLPALAAAPSRYEPSGRVAWAHALPMAAAATATACTMACFLLRIEHLAYLPLVTPLVLALPVLLTIALAIHFGRCRNIMLAGGFAGVVVTLYYVGFWVLSYHELVRRAGPNVARWLEQSVGVGGLTGYFIARCQIVGAQTGMGTLAAVALRALEFGLVVAAGLYAARRLSGRAYYETHQRWASSRAFCFKPADLPEVRAAIDRAEWWRLGAVDKVTSSREQRARGLLLCRAEYLPRSHDQPVYLSVEGPVLRRLRWLLAVLPVLARLTSRVIVQHLVPPEHGRLLAAQIGGIDLSPGPAVNDPGAAAAGIGYWNDAPARAGGAGEGALASMIGELGFSGVTLVGTGEDFRDAADRASARAMAAAAGVAPGDATVSLCYRVDPEPVPKLKRASWLDLVTAFGFPIGILLSFIAQFSGALAFSLGRYRAALALLIGSGAAAAFGLGCLAFQVLLCGRVQKWLLMRRFARRSPPLFDADRALPKLPGRIEDPATFHVGKVTPEDWIVCQLDATRRRLLIEGISHRYVIRGEDVTAIEPVGSAVASVRVDLVIGGTQPLAIVVARYSPAAGFVYALAAQPVIGPLFRGAAAGFGRRFARRLRETLRH
jgi:hypothetical protein